MKNEDKILDLQQKYYAVADEVKELSRSRLQLNRLSWSSSLMNYSGTLLGVIVYVCCVVLLFRWYDSHLVEMGIVAPIVLVFMIQLLISGLRFIPTPISTYEVVEER